MSKAVLPKMRHQPVLTHTDQIQEQINEFSARDLQLSSIGALTLILLAAFALAIVFPNILWAQPRLKLEAVYLPQVFFGLISLIVLFNIYLLGQKATVLSLRRSLISELVLNERLESLSLVDPVTQLLNARGMAQLVPKEIARANRLGTNLTFLKIDMSVVSEVNTKFGVALGTSLLTEFGKLLRLVFRGGDIVFRPHEHEFLIAMPDTREDQTDPPLQRLLGSVEQWNLNSGQPYEISFKWAFAQYVVGSSFEDVQRALDRKMSQPKQKLAPVARL